MRRRCRRELFILGPSISTRRSCDGNATDSRRHQIAFTLFLLILLSAICYLPCIAFTSYRLQVPNPAALLIHITSNYAPDYITHCLPNSIGCDRNQCRWENSRRACIALENIYDDCSEGWQIRRLRKIK